MNKKDTENFLNNELAILAATLSDVPVTEQKVNKREYFNDVKVKEMILLKENQDLKNQIKNKVKVKVKAVK